MTDIVDELKAAFGLEHDRELADLLKVQPARISEFRRLKRLGPKHRLAVITVSEQLRVNLPPHVRERILPLSGQSVKPDAA